MEINVMSPDLVNPQYYSLLSFLFVPVAMVPLDCQNRALTQHRAPLWPPSQDKTWVSVHGFGRGHNTLLTGSLPCAKISEMSKPLSSGRAQTEDECPGAEEIKRLRRGDPWLYLYDDYLLGLDPMLDTARVKSWGTICKLRT